MRKTKIKTELEKEKETKHRKKDLLQSPIYFTVISCCRRQEFFRRKHSLK